MKLTRAESLRAAGETGADLAEMYGLLFVEQYRQWFRAPKKGKGVFKLQVDRAGMCATYIDLYEQKRECLENTDVEE